jgi:ABC-type Mn2+/Zn2+ transport system ATPase subunit
MPQLWIVAGPNGAGKTTFADRWLSLRIPVVSPTPLPREAVLVRFRQVGLRSQSQSAGWRQFRVRYHSFR